MGEQHRLRCLGEFHYDVLRLKEDRGNDKDLCAVCFFLTDLQRWSLNKVHGNPKLAPRQFLRNFPNQLLNEIQLTKDILKAKARHHRNASDRCTRNPNQQAHFNKQPGAINEQHQPLTQQVLLIFQEIQPCPFRSTCQSSKAKVGATTQRRFQQSQKQIKSQTRFSQQAIRPSLLFISYLSRSKSVYILCPRGCPTKPLNHPSRWPAKALDDSSRP